MFEKVLEKIVEVKREEWRGLLLATLYAFLIFVAYYIMRPVRDEISSADRGNLQILWTAVFFVMLVAIPAYSWITSRVRRGLFVPYANRFFILNLLGFYLLLVLLPAEARPWIDRVFYVWISVFNLFAVSVFWQLVADCFTNEQGKRMFGFIAVGSSIGGLAGSSLTAAIAASVPVFALLLLACVPLEAAAWCARGLDRMFTGPAPGRPAQGGGGVPEEADSSKPLPGTAWSGIKVILESPYLMGIAGFFALMTFASGVLYFQQSFIIGEAIADRGERTVVFAQMDMAVNTLTIFFQVYLTAKIMKWVGVGAALALIPALIFGGFVVLGLYPTLAVIVVIQVLYRSGRYGITRPAREVLYTVLTREQKYKSKAFIDAAVYRGGDLVTGWIYAGLALFLTTAAIALVAVPPAAAWALLGARLGAQQKDRALKGWGAARPRADAGPPVEPSPAGMQ